MDIRIILAVGLSAAVLLVAWLVMRARSAKSARLEDEAQEQSESDRVASERLARLAAARREDPEAQDGVEEEFDADLADAEEPLTGEVPPIEEPAPAAPDEAGPEPDPSYGLAEATEPVPDIAGPDAWTAVLKAQVPINREAPLRSWLGGRPHLPFGTEWPEVDGARLVFFAGICLEDLGAEIWQGAGPREGWLLVFLHPETHAPHSLHVPSIGTGEDERPEAFRTGYELFSPYGGHPSNDARAARVPRCFAEWPVVIEKHPEVGEGEDRAYAAPTMAPQAAETMNFAEPALYPVDEFATLAMLDTITDDFTRLHATRYADAEQIIATGRNTVETLRRSLASVLEAEEPDQDKAETLRQELSQAEALHNAWVAEVETNSAAEAHLRELAEAVRAHATRNGLKPAEIAQIVQGLSEVPVAWRSRSGEVGNETITLSERPITEVSPGDLHPGSSMVAVATEHAKHAYSRRPEVLSDQQRAFWEQRFVRDAARPLGKIGGLPVGHVDDFDPQTEALVLELESSNLVGWTFGDTDRLVLTLPREALRDGAWDALKLHISNC